MNGSIPDRRLRIALTAAFFSMGCSSPPGSDDVPLPPADAAPGALDAALVADGGPEPDLGGSAPVSCAGGSLTDEWSASHVGGTGTASLASGSESELCLRAAGADIWAMADDFLFVHRPRTGDFSLVARVALEDASHEFAKAGLMVRSALTPDAVHALVNTTPRIDGASRGDYLTYRSEAGARSLSMRTDAPTGDRWLRLSRRGDTIRADRSSDGEAWEPIGQVTLNGLPETVLVGAALTSHAEEPATARLDRIAWGEPVAVEGCGDGLCAGLETCSTCASDCSCSSQGIEQDPYRATNAPAAPRRPAEGSWVNDGALRYASVDADVRNHYSNVPAFNADDSLILLSGSRPPLVDAATLERIRIVDLNGLATHHAWLNRTVNAHRVFAVSSTAAYLVDVFSDERTLLRDFAGEYDEIDFGPGEGAVSMDDRMVALVARRGDDAYVLSFDIETRTVVGTLRMAGRWRAGERKPRFDYAIISRSGRWVLINTRYDTRGGIVRWDVDFRDSLTLTGLGKHSDACVNQAGEEVLVSLTRPPRAYRLSDGAEQVLPTLEDNWGGHVSCQNTARPGWAYVSRKDTKELFAIRLDESRTVERFGWHFSTEHDYRAEAHPSVSRDGSRIIFNSDWGDPDRANGSYLVEAR